MTISKEEEKIVGVNIDIYYKTFIVVLKKLSL